MQFNLFTVPEYVFSSASVDAYWPYIIAACYTTKRKEKRVKILLIVIHPSISYVTASQHPSVMYCDQHKKYIYNISEWI